MAEEEIGGGFTLADLADLDVSDIEEVRFVDLPAGVYGFEIKEAELKEYEQDGDTKYKAEVEMEIIEVKAVVPTPGEPAVDKEQLVGKRHTERLVIDPTKEVAEQQKAIGRIRAFVTDVGMDSKGKLGDIVKNLKGHTFTGKVVKQPDKNDKSKKWSRLKLDPKK